MPPQHRLSQRDRIGRRTQPDPAILLLSLEVA